MEGPLEKIAFFIFYAGIYEYGPDASVNFIAVNVQVIGFVFIDENGIPNIMIVIYGIDDLVKSFISVVTVSAFGN